MDLNTEKIGRLVRELLIEIGEDPAREGLLNTPQRVAKAFNQLPSRELRRALVGLIEKIAGIQTTSRKKKARKKKRVSTHN